MLDVAERQQVSEGHPAGPALAAFPELEVALLQLREEGGHARAVVPEDDGADLHPLEVLQRAPVSRFVGAVERDHDRVEVGELGHLVADARERGALELADEAGDEERGARAARVARDGLVQLAGSAGF